MAKRKSKRQTSQQVKARCQLCKRVFPVTVCRKWWESSEVSCCGRMAAVWLDRAGELILDGYPFDLVE